MKRNGSASYQYANCCSTAAAFASARICARMDTISMVVSIFVIFLLSLRVCG